MQSVPQKGGAVFGLSSPWKLETGSWNLERSRSTEKGFQYLVSSVQLPERSYPTPAVSNNSTNKTKKQPRIIRHESHSTKHKIKKRKA